MTYLIKYKWALIGTFFLHIGVMAYMNRVKLERHYVPMGQLEQIPLVLEDQFDIPEEEKMKQEMQNGKISNITVNENDKVGESDKKYDSRAVKISDSDVEKDMRDYEKNAFDEAASKHKKDDIVIDDPKLNVKKDKKDDNSQSSNENNKVRSAGRVSGSYDLDGRRDEYFAKPAYVCKGSGTIVLKVKVNRSGKVVSATIDSGQSSYTEDCMGENAVKYAYKCKFEAGTQWPEPQSGTVTYTYISQ